MRLVFLSILSLTGLGAFYSCQPKMACPAYHSSFILDTRETRRQFSLFGEDSLPRDVWEVNKKKVGIADEVAYWKKDWQMRTIPMKSVYIPLEDPFAFFQRDFVARGDSMMLADSVNILASVYDDFVNIDQMIYLYHFGKYLQKRKTPAEQLAEELIPDPDEPLIRDMHPETEPEKPGKTRKRGLFGRKKGQDIPEPSEEE